MKLWEALEVLIIVIIGYCLVFGGLGAWLWPYATNSWLMYCDKPPTMLWWHGGLIGLIPVLGQWCIPIGLITFLLLLFL